MLAGESTPFALLISGSACCKYDASGHSDYQQHRTDIAGFALLRYCYTSSECKANCTSNLWQGALGDS
ncbi:hypothetical protein DV515_00004457 [Chloebia gouldiae]|uniref:Uncharacterized protein n=1 Tax=Chloebia gouldiae TaxID=44316 RepID=A0A3L8SQ50_CHLGU|nr:hypothetical protein DV515_00004457 [Chloebia gouldiae]